MQRISLDRMYVPKEPLPSGGALGHLSSLERAARIADIKDKMVACLEELDRLELPYAANYLSHAIAMLEHDS